MQTQKQIQISTTGRSLTHLIKICDDPDNIAAAKDENNEDKKRGDLLVTLLSARRLTVPQARVLRIEMFIENTLKRCY